MVSLWRVLETNEKHMRYAASKRQKGESFRIYREEETAELIKKVAQSCTCSSPVNISELLVSLTRNLICRAAFGMKYGESEGGRKLKELLDELGELLGAFSWGDFIQWLGWIDQINKLNARVEKIFKEFDHFLDGVINDHLDRQDVDVSGMKEDHMDLLDVLLKNQNDNSGICLGRENIKAILLDMFAGATDTTYTVIEWAMTELIRHPETLKIAQEEIRRPGGSNSENITDENNLEKVIYLKAIIKETVRLHSPVPLLLPRKPEKDVNVGAYYISSQTRMILNAWAIGGDPASWEEAEKFRPEWFVDSSNFDLEGQNFKLLPFRARRRGCPGATFALAIVELVLANLLYKFNWALPGGARGEDLDASESSGIAEHKKYPLALLATPC